jgi:hypothetical protein
MHRSRDPVPDHLWIEVDLGAKSIAGAIHSGSDPVRPFDGWLELVALLEAARGSAAEGSGADGSAGDSP